MIVLGIDPGLSGGLALVAGSPGQRLRLIDAMDVPVHGDAAKRRVNVGAVLDFIQRNAPDRGLIERAQLIPDQNISAGGIYMRAVGALEACVEGLGVPLLIIESSAWKKYHGLSRKSLPEGLSRTQATAAFKENSRQRAILLFAGNHRLFDRKKDHNRAEAALIAAYGATLV